MTVLIGLLLTVAGMLLSILSLTITTSVAGRLLLVIVGIAVSLAGIIGFVNRAYMKNAIWRVGR
jgi:hypothetical protein